MWSGGIKRNATDAYFSNIVRAKANWCCERCFRDFHNNKQGLHCSHFATRGNKRVRWDFNNALSLCARCHDYFGKNPYEHTEFMKKKLGDKKFTQLLLSKTRKVSDQKIDEKLVRLGLRLEWEKMQSKSNENIFGYRELK